MTTQLTISETIDLAHELAMRFPEVEKYPLSGPDNLQTPLYALFATDRESGETECISDSVKQGYTPHTIDDVTTLVESACSSWHGAVITTHFDRGHKIIVAPSREQRELLCNVGGNPKDSIWPRLTINSGYDGTCHTGSLGLYRDPCKNLMIPRLQGRAFSFSIKHTRKLREIMPRLVEQFTELGNNWRELQTIVNRWQSVEVAIDSTIRAIVPPPENDSRRTRTNYTELVSSIVNRLYRDRLAMIGSVGESNRANLWEIVNAIQGYQQHDARRRNSPSTIERALLALESNMVNDAYAYANSMALAS